MNLAEAVGESLRRRPEKVISRDDNREFTGGQLLDSCRAAAGRLAPAGGGRRVGLLLPNLSGYPAALLGVLWAGKVAVPLNPMLKPNELAFLFQDAAIDTVVVADPTASLVAGLNVRQIPIRELLSFDRPAPADPAPADADAEAVMLFTSGTSGKPKGVPLTHANLLSNAQTLIDRAGLTEREVFLGVMPIFHAFGLTGSMLTSLLLGAEATYQPRFHPERSAAAVAERGVTVFIGVPAMFGLLARGRGYDEGLRNLRLPVSGGEALPSAYREGYRQRFGRDVLEGYGLTETSPVLAVNVPGENKPGTVGRPLPGVRVRVAPEDGEIQVRGPGVMKGYHNRPEEDAHAFTADGWFRTGDMGQLDADGYLSITGRIKELIIRGGEKVMPREVEEVLSQCPGVREAAVVGEADGDRGEAVVAFVVPGDEAPTPEAVRDFCRARLAEFKVPRRVTVATDLPRGPTGKLLKRALKEWKPG
ncbi:MAG TPA: AMP-binding protein [Gemmataceae bacterium]|nr:AMP-binding protein [Gemmataceae bacterium]